MPFFSWLALADTMPCRVNLGGAYDAFGLGGHSIRGR
jgi:hypothetical protein